MRSQNKKLALFSFSMLIYDNHAYLVADGMAFLRRSSIVNMIKFIKPYIN